MTTLNRGQHILHVSILLTMAGISSIQCNFLEDLQRVYDLTEFATLTRGNQAIYHLFVEGDFFKKALFVPRNPSIASFKQFYNRLHSSDAKRFALYHYIAIIKDPVSGNSILPTYENFKLMNKYTHTIDGSTRYLVPSFYQYIPWEHAMHHFWQKGSEYFINNAKIESFHTVENQVYVVIDQPFYNIMTGEKQFLEVLVGKSDFRTVNNHFKVLLRSPLMTEDMKCEVYCQRKISTYLVYDNGGWASCFSTVTMTDTIIQDMMNFYIISGIAVFHRHEETVEGGLFLKAKFEFLTDKIRLSAPGYTVSWATIKNSYLTQYGVIHQLEKPFFCHPFYKNFENSTVMRTCLNNAPCNKKASNVQSIDVFIDLSLTNLNAYQLVDKYVSNSFAAHVSTTVPYKIYKTLDNNEYFFSTIGGKSYVFGRLTNQMFHGNEILNKALVSNLITNHNIYNISGLFGQALYDSSIESKYTKFFELLYNSNYSNYLDGWQEGTLFIFPDSSITHLGAAKWDKFLEVLIKSMIGNHIIPTCLAFENLLVGRHSFSTASGETIDLEISDVTTAADPRLRKNIVLHYKSFPPIPISTTEKPIQLKHNHVAYFIDAILHDFDSNTLETFVKYDKQCHNNANCKQNMEKETNSSTFIIPKDILNNSYSSSIFQCLVLSADDILYSDVDSKYNFRQVYNKLMNNTDCQYFISRYTVPNTIKCHIPFENPYTHRIEYDCSPHSSCQGYDHLSHSCSNSQTYVEIRAIDQFFTKHKIMETMIETMKRKNTVTNILLVETLNAERSYSEIVKSNCDRFISKICSISADIRKYNLILLLSENALNNNKLTSKNIKNFEKFHLINANPKMFYNNDLVASKTTTVSGSNINIQYLSVKNNPVLSPNIKTKPSLTGKLTVKGNGKKFESMTLYESPEKSADEDIYFMFVDFILKF